MRLCNHKATLSDGFNRSIWALVVLRRGENHDIGRRELAAHGLDAPRNSASSVRHDPKRVAAHMRQDSLEGLDVACVPEPKQFCAGTVGQVLGELVAVRNYIRWAPDTLRENLRRASDLIRDLDEFLIERRMQVVVTEVHNDPLGSARQFQVAIHWLREDQRFSGRVIHLNAEVLSRNGRAVAIARHCRAATVDKGNHFSRGNFTPHCPQKICFLPTTAMQLGQRRR